MPTALLITTSDQLPADARIWGTGGWLPPEQREALDWLTLLLFMGWRVEITYTDTDVEPALLGDVDAVVVACEPQSLPEDLLSQIAATLDRRPITVVSRVALAGSPLASLSGSSSAGRRPCTGSIEWRGPGPQQSWECTQSWHVDSMSLLGDAHVWGMFGDTPLIAVRKVGLGAVASLSCHPSVARDASGAVTMLLRTLLVYGNVQPRSCLDLSGCMILRMDDPGGAQNVHFRDWRHRKLDLSDWDELASGLRARDARLSVGYVVGWVDDGDSGRGGLEVAGRDATRIPGKIHSSPQVRYTETSADGTHVLHDYVAEYRGVRKLCDAGLAEAEVHGFTHMHPELQQWIQAPDRYESADWFRELCYQDPVLRGKVSPLGSAIPLIERYFESIPTTVISPGDRWNESALLDALDLQLKIVSSYYLAIEYEGRWCWTTHVCAPYLDEVDPAFLAHGLPVIGYCHDRDLDLHGNHWFFDHIDRWREAGVTRFITFGDLSRLLCEGTSNR